jgi:hypothetical protein
MKSISLTTTLLTLLATTLPVQAGTNIDWDKHIYDEQEYFKNIPDQINMNATRFRFKLIHWFLTGVERGLYNDTTIVLDDDCFGD